MDPRLQDYDIHDVDRIITPALMIYPELVDVDVTDTLKMLGNDPDRWRPHIKTAKLGAILSRLIEYRIVNFKCSTTLELLTACQAGAADILLAYSVIGANAQRALDIAEDFPRTRVSVLVEASEQATTCRCTEIGVFVDIYRGMHRTEIEP